MINFEIVLAHKTRAAHGSSI